MSKDNWDLPKPTNRKKMKPVGFTTEARIVHRLGTESVSDQILSIMELIKNSYDAKSNEVMITLENMKTGDSKITVKDNGFGMSLNEFTTGWLRLATSIKHTNKKKKGGRNILGEKGIGRLAVENLSRKTTVTSYPNKSEIGYEVTFDWDDYSVNVDLETIKNKMESFDKPKNAHGLKITLENLRYRWTEDDAQRLWRTIKVMSPPSEDIEKFKISIITDEFTDVSGSIDSNFLNKSAFSFSASHLKTGDVSFTMWKHGKKRPVKQKMYKYPTQLTCGPVEFDLYFYYLEKKKMETFGVSITNLTEFRKTLQSYGGVKIYRDRIRLSGFGNEDDDWLGLDRWSRNEPSVVPSTHQIISSVKISSQYNPEINDTAARENIIKNRSYQDLVEFIRHSIGVFAQMRAEIELKRKSSPKSAAKFVQKIKKTVQENQNKKALLDNGDDYPYKIFYSKLEEEINICYLASLPNATLMLSRKLVENLLYNILERKFPQQRNLWFRDTKKGGRTHDFSVLLENLDKHTSEFHADERTLINKLITHVEPFRNEANTKAHQVIEYLNDTDDLDELKIPEIVEIALELYRKVKSSK